MALEQLANNPTSTLNGAINSSVTTVTLTSASSFPTSGNFRLIVDSEIMKVTAVSGNDLTVVRGQEGSSPASHSSGATATGILTKAGMEAWRADLIFSDTYANIPSAALSSRLFLPSDFLGLYRDTGSAWVARHGLTKDLTAPVSGDFSWLNQGSATIDTSNYGVYLEAPSDGGSVNVRARIKSYSAPKKFTAMFDLHPEKEGAGGAGILLYDTNTGKITNIYTYASVGNSGIFCEHWTNTTSINGTVFGKSTANNILAARQVWLQLEDDNTNVYFRHSIDGIVWRTLASESRTNFSATAFNRVGHFVRAQSMIVGQRLLHWKEE